MALPYSFLTILACVAGTLGQQFFQPEQTHLSYGASPSEMVVTWVTLSQTNASVVEYGQNNLNMVAKGTVDAFKDGGSLGRIIYMHRVWLQDLKPGQTYIYHCGSPLGWSNLFTFSAMKEGTTWSPRFAVYGDMGNVNAQSLARLQEEAQRGHFDAILHVGDFAYNMDTNDATVGDAFMNQIESLAASVPYMTCVGNHEQAYNFSNYRSRFTMPGGDKEGMFFSFDVGPAIIVSFSSEFYYFVEYGWQQIVNQFEWLEADLKEANKPENRAKRPWIITMCHRPLYCSNSDDQEHCPNVENIIRVGIPYSHEFSIEELLYKYGVDLHFAAHEHSYERMWPVFNRTVCNGTSSEPYTNPGAPIHIVTGSAGCQEGVDPFEKIPNPWSALHSDDYGYSRLSILNDTHLYMDYVSDDKDGKVIDEMMVVKDKHGAGLYDCHSQQKSKEPTYYPRGRKEQRYGKQKRDPNVLYYN